VRDDHDEQMVADNCGGKYLPDSLTLFEQKKQGETWLQNPKGSANLGEDCSLIQTMFVL